MPVTESTQMCALLASTERIVRIIKRGQVYEVVYTPENTPKVALENLQSALVQLYGASLKLLANSRVLFSKNMAARTVYAILNPNETADLFSNLKELETRLGSEVQACESGRSAATDSHLSDLLRSLNTPLTRIDETVCALLEQVSSKERLEIFEWISPVPFGKHHNTVKEARVPGTCDWLLEHNRFRGWEDTSSSVILWLQGSRRFSVTLTPFGCRETNFSLAGVGKTFLTSKVIDHVQDILQGSPNHEGFAYFYCNRNETERREPLSILRSYVRQLSTTARNPRDMQKKLRSLYSEARLKGSDFGFDICKRLLLESINLYPKTTLVLDALDECESDLRGQLIDNIEFLVSKSEKPLKIFISSRPDGDIRDCFLSRPNIEIQATDNRDDIKKYVNQEIVKHRRWTKMSRSLRDDIVKTLLERSQGM